MMMDGPRSSAHSLDSPPASLNWDQFCDVLDGVPWDALIPGQSGFGNPECADDALLLKNALAGPNQYFFDTNRTKHPIEIFWLKVSLCELLCRHIAEVHEQTHRAYVGLDPSRVAVSIPTNPSTLLPLRWNCSLALRTVPESEVSQLDDMPREMARGLAAMPASLDLSYAAPLVREWPLGRKLSVTALIQSADAIPDDDEHAVRGLVRVHLIADALSVRDCSDQDVFRVTLSSGTSRGSAVKLWARKVDLPERGIVVSGMTDPVTPDVWASFSQAGLQVRSAAEIAVYRSFTSICDAHSCGLLLLRALLGSKAGRWVRALEVWPALLEGLNPLVQGVEEGDHYTIHERVRDRLRERGDLFEPAAVPEGLWYDALVAVLRACTRIQGFSYRQDPNLLERSVARDFGRDLALLSRRARTELFECQEYDVLIARACDRVLADLGAGL